MPLRTAAPDVLDQRRSRAEGGGGGRGRREATHGDRTSVRVGVGLQVDSLVSDF